MAKKGEGTFSEVLKAQCIKNSKYVAIKCMKNHFDSLEQVADALSPDEYSMQIVLLLQKICCCSR